MKEIWTEKYRPNKLVDYVFRDQAQREQVEGWVKSGAIPHLLFSGSPGVGKTTLARILIHELGIDPFDVMEINASRENNIDTIRAKITGFVQTMPFGDFKIVLLDEADYITPNGQAALRGVMETYSSTARFILTCNYPNRVIPALHSRCQGFHIERVDQTEFTARVAEILMQEGITPDLEILDTYVKATYPDLRKCINVVQMNAQNGVLLKPQKSDTGESDYKLGMVELFKAGKITEARKLVCSQVRPDEVEDIFKWMYDNITLFGDEARQEKAILIIKQGLVDHTLISDPEINLAATMIRLQNL